MDNLLDIPKEDEAMEDAFFNSITGNSADSSTVTVVDSCNSSVSGGDGHFNGNMSSRSFSNDPFTNNELCVQVKTLRFIRENMLFLIFVLIFPPISESNYYLVIINLVRQLG